MDYEKKYKEALERARQFYAEYIKRDNQWYRKDIESVFPELKESEDERIRKEIIQYIKDLNVTKNLGSEYSTEWIAWLESQQKENLNLKDQIESLHAALVAKDKTWEIRMAEQKTQSHWSEEERIRKNCIHFLELQKAHHASTMEIDECIAWLEKQKPIDEKMVDDIDKGVRKKWALSFIEYLDTHCYDGKMCVSNMEC